jgi:hypothetical protein
VSGGEECGEWGADAEWGWVECMVRFRWGVGRNTVCWSNNIG